jgi:hypothetical protein
MDKLIEMTALSVLIVCTSAIFAAEKPALKPLNNWWTAEYVQLQIDRAREADNKQAVDEWEKWKKRNIDGVKK